MKKRIAVYRTNCEEPLIYKEENNPSLTATMTGGCLCISSVDGILLILPLTQLVRVERL